MAWGFLGTTTLVSTSDNCEITGITSKKFINVVFHGIPSGQIDGYFRFNSDSTTKYANRRSENGNTDQTAVSQNKTFFTRGVTAYPTNSTFSVGYICDIDGEEKLYIAFCATDGGTGASNDPDRMEVVGKYVPSPSARITAINDFNSDSGDWAVDTNITAIGTD